MESILAVGLVMSVIIGSITMGIYVTRLGRSSDNKIVALNLAREGIEYVRNVRDSNWLKESEGIENIETGVVYNWNDSLAEGNYILNQYLDTDVEGNDIWVSELTSSNPLDDCKGSDCLLMITTIGIYNHESGGTPTNFSRVINITEKMDTDSSDYLNVVSKVHWLENGQPKDFTLEENLYDWRED